MENEQKYIRTPSKRCRIIDLLTGEYDENNKEIKTILGFIRRVRIYGNVIKKITHISNGENNESMIRNAQGQNIRISFLIDDGTGSFWMNLFSISEEKYNYINEGDLVHIVGIVKKDENGNLLIFPDFIQKIEDINFEILHLLNLIEERKRSLDLIKESDNNFKIESRSLFQQKDIIKQSDLINSKTEEINISKDNLNLGNEIIYEDTIKLLDEDKEATILNYIKDNDTEKGVSFNDILKNINISEKELKEILDFLIFNTKIYTNEYGNYKAYIF